MESEKIDIGFITETWINNTIDLELITSQAKHVGYTIISHEHTNMKGGGLYASTNQNLMLKRSDHSQKNPLKD